MTLLAPVSKSLAATCLKEPPDVITSSNSNTFLPLYKGGETMRVKVRSV